ncbi:uncharacterized protein LOC132197694 isoform X2 [Neocloeon triangulifer]|uniref:uncharacterized protein LOC132197694 isoform X2 n=1 Tax=Neocloeon triangulifer TaxID=2078957 RepID=UPI00286F5ABB|nr:uncharacterized protein LOC132197694 isoform X2 [Neocloeon triangulifer]
MASEMMSPNTRVIALLAGALGTFQALCWGNMALLAVIGHGDCPLWDATSTFLIAMQRMYFQERTCLNNPINPSLPAFSWAESIMGPGSILAWMIILLAIDCIWFFASLCLIAAWKSSRLTFTSIVSAMWCVVTSVVIIVDLVACAMFGADYGKIVSAPIAHYAYLAPPAVIMTLVARGFVLWVVNLVLLTLLVRSLPALRQHKKAVKEHERQMAMVDLYGPPAPGHDSFHNHGFVPDYTRPPSNQPPRGFTMYPRPDYSPPGRRVGRARSASPVKHFARNKPRQGY